MKTYDIGYYNKPWNNSDFVILAQTKSAAVSDFILRSYNEGYERAGLSVRAVIVEHKELKCGYRFAD